MNYKSVIEECDEVINNADLASLSGALLELSSKLKLDIDTVELGLALERVSSEFEYYSKTERYKELKSVIAGVPFRQEFGDDFDVIKELLEWSESEQGLTFKNDTRDFRLDYSNAVHAILSMEKITMPVPESKASYYNGALDWMSGFWEEVSWFCIEYPFDDLELHSIKMQRDKKKLFMHRFDVGRKAIFAMRKIKDSLYYGNESRVNAFLDLDYKPSNLLNGHAICARAIKSYLESSLSESAAGKKHFPFI